MGLRDQAGFKIMDLMVVVSITGTLAAVAIPNYVEMRQRAQEASIKANMHTLQGALEDFAIQNDSFYPTDAKSALADGRTLAQLCPKGDFPVNPYTGIASMVWFNAPLVAGEPGTLAIAPATSSDYRVRGNGSHGTPLALALTSGQ